MKTRFFIVLAVLISPLVSMANLAMAEQKKPNIVFIMADDLGYRELGCFGQEKAKTPNLDRFATEGVRLTQHYAGNAVCATSRCVLMTGKHPGHAFIRCNKDNIEPNGEFNGEYPIPDSEVTLAELLRKQGYVTGAFGKWGLGGVGTEGEPLRQGFDRFFGYNSQRNAHSYYPPYLCDDEGKCILNNNPPIPGHARLPEDADPNDPHSFDCFKGQDYSSDRIRDQALAFLRANKDKPFFPLLPEHPSAYCLADPGRVPEALQRVGLERSSHDQQGWPLHAPLFATSGLRVDDREAGSQRR